MSNSTLGFSERYLAQVEAERLYVVQQLEGTESKNCQCRLPETTDIARPLVATMGAMPTLEEAYLSVFVENRRKTTL